ncbi:MAG: glutaredoxin [Candidatus Marinimicrobia bacterium]|nr:glutaredoxin [Candidatus Neomarinimicrobiota bacterium]
MIKIYTTSWCPYCVAAKRLLTERGKKYEEINIEAQEMSREDLFAITGGRSVPQIVINDEMIGGYDNLVELDSAGKI